MDKITGRLTVYFQDPFWVGVFERVEEGKLSVCRIPFGAEPSEAELYTFILENYNQLQFSPAVDFVIKKTAKNPKRRQREAAKAMKRTGIGTKSQQVLQMQREAMKTERRESSRERKLAEKQRKFELKQKKRKEKHRGH